MAIGGKRGFVPIRNQVGGADFRSNLYRVTTDLLSPIFSGDPVSLVSGQVQRWTTANSANFIGVVKACYDSNKRPLTHSLPTKAAFINTSTAGFVDVYDSPHTNFTVACEVSVGSSMIGQSAIIAVSGGNSATGISRSHIAAVSAGDTTANFRIVGLSPLEQAVTAAGSPGQEIEVTPVVHLFR